jgi:hypothetical protein
MLDQMAQKKERNLRKRKANDDADDEPSQEEVLDVQ